MTQPVRRIYVEKKADFAVEAQNLYTDLKVNLGITGLTGVRVVNRYDMAGVSEAEYVQARTTIFAEPTVDEVYDEELPLAAGDRVFAIEYLPGQYDQRADSAAQCLQILTQRERPTVLAAKVIILQGDLSDDDFDRIKHYCINPIECREAALTKPDCLEMSAPPPADVTVLTGFTTMAAAELAALHAKLGLAMSLEDLSFCQVYFRDEERRDPTITEIRVIDTYWSDH